MDGPFGPGGKLSSTTTCEWFAGGFHLVCRGEEHGPTDSISDLDESEHNTGGTIVGNRRTFVFDMDMEGKPTQLRYVEVVTKLAPALASRR